MPAAIIVASILAADFARLGRETAAVQEAGADWIHVDVMDGHFVPNLSMGPLAVEAVRRVTDLPIDAHLMIDNPDRFVGEFAAAGATHISVHAEAAPRLAGCLERVKRSGAHPGIALGPAAPLSMLEDALELADYVDLIAVKPGFGGQQFQPAVLERIRTFRAELARRGLSVIIESDGGINEGTIAGFAAAGVEAFVIGSGIFRAGDYPAAIRRLRREVERGRASEAGS